MRSRTVELFIPTFEKDLCMLTYASRSISNFDPDASIIGDVHIQWISTNPLNDYGDALEEAISGFDPEVRNVAVRETLVKDANTGWYVQMAAKLEAARFVKSDYFVVLDSKNVAARPLSPLTFFDADGFPVVSKLHSRTEAPWLWTWYDGAQQTLNTTLPDIRMPNSITPTVFKTALAIELVEMLERTHGSALQAFSDSAHRAGVDSLEESTRETHTPVATEFTCYHTYVFMRLHQSKDQWEKSYKSEYPMYTVWETLPWLNKSTSDISDRAVEELEELFLEKDDDDPDRPAFFGVHNQFWEALKPDAVPRVSMLFRRIYDSLGVAKEDDNEDLLAACSTPSIELATLGAATSSKRHKRKRFFKRW